MQDLSWTLFFAVLHIVLYLLLLWLTRYPILTVFHVALAGQLLAFGIRPILAFLVGGYTLYPVSGGWSLYNLGLFYELIGMLFYAVGYIMTYRPRFAHLVVIGPTVKKGFWWSFAIGTLAFATIAILSKGAFLPTARTSTITSVVPFGRILFRLAIIPLSVALPLGYLIIRKRDGLWLLVIPIFAVTFVMLAFLYQRGFALFGFILCLFLWERFSKLRYRNALVGGIILLSIAAVLRPLVNTLAGAPISGHQWHISLSSFLLYGASFDKPDVWKVAIAYVQQNGLVLGKTFLTLFAKILPPELRYSLGLITATDLLNIYYQGEHYWTSNFGFNVSLTQELFLNWGPFSLVMTFIPGMIAGRIDRWLHSLKRLNVRSIYVIAGAFFTGGFLGALAGTLQWVITYILIGYAFDVISRLSLVGKRCGAYLRRQGKMARYPPGQNI